MTDKIPHDWIREFVKANDNDLKRHYFPETFARIAKQSRGIGARLVRIKGVRMFLDELPLPETPDLPEITEDISCGPQCSGGAAHR